MVPLDTLTACYTVTFVALCVIATIVGLAAREAWHWLRSRPVFAGFAWTEIVMALVVAAQLGGFVWGIARCVRL